MQESREWQGTDVGFNRTLVELKYNLKNDEEET